MICLDQKFREMNFLFYIVPSSAHCLEIDLYTKIATFQAKITLMWEKNLKYILDVDFFELFTLF